MHDNSFVSKEFLTAWGAKVYSLLERNDVDTNRNRESIEEMRKSCSLCLVELKVRFEKETAERKLAALCLEKLLVTRLLQLEMESRVDSAVVKVKLALWGSIGGIVATVLIQFILKLILEG